MNAQRAALVSEVEVRPPTEAPGGVLWSRATARDIVAVIAEDAESGRLAPAEAVELIDRVWERAGR